MHYLVSLKLWQSRDVIQALSVLTELVYFFLSAQPYSTNFETTRIVFLLRASEDNCLAHLSSV